MKFTEIMSIDLKKHWRKCRLCIKKIRNERIAVEITKKIAQDFFDLTNLEVDMKKSQKNKT